MKKRLLSALLALALVFVLLPTTALADTTPVTDENVKINGTPVTVGNGISLGEGNGTYSYDKSTRTLTLNNATITATGSNIGIDFCDTTNYVTYSVILTGENTVTSNNIAIETTPNTNLTFTGGGNLKAITNGYYQAIRVYGTLTIDNSTLIAESSAYTATTVIWTLAMTGNNAKLEISNKSAANIVAGTAGASKNIDWSNYQFTTGSYSGDALTESDPEVCSWGTLNEYLGFPTKKYSQYICIAKRTIALETTADVYIAGGPAVVGVRTSLGEGNGYYTYNKDTKTFTLENVNITSVINAIQLMADGTYTINLVGTNTISDVSAGIVASNLYGANDITAVLSGTGSLDITAGHYAIDMQKVGNLKFENTGTIKLTTGYKYPASTCNALYVVGNVTIDTTKYGITGQKQAQGFPTEDIGNSPVFETILKGTDSTLYFKTITIAPKPSKTYYNGTAMKYGETKTVGNGTISCDENGVITLNGVTEGTLEFRSSADSTLVLNGTNTLSSIVTTQKGLTISGSGSLTAGSIRVTNNYNIHADLIITGGATVIAGTTTSDAKAIDITGNLTVNSGATLTATNTSETNPTIDVSGNVTISGDPGTNAYTVSAHNSCDVQKDRDGHLSASGVPSAIKIGGTLNISAGARVMAQTDSYGAGVMLSQNSTITVEDAFLSAKNSSCDFAAISFSGQTGKIDVSGEKGEVVAENTHAKTNLVYRAINAFVYNSNTDFYLKMQSEGVINEAVNKIIAPGGHNASGGKKVTITRGDEVTRTNSPVVIAGTTLLNDTYYTINGSTVAEGTEDNYNAFYDSETKTLKLNNAQISHSFAHEYGGGTDGAIIFKEYKNYCIELSGTNTISSMNTNAINGDTNSLTIKNAAEAENAKLTLTSNWMVICSIGGLNIQSDVTMVNTKEAGYLMYVNDTFSFDGYNAYASVNASGSPLVEYTVPTSGDKDAGYQYLRITKETLETGGGSTHQHTYDQSAWKSDATHHWQECTDPNCPDPTKGITNKAPHSFSNGTCTICGYRGQTEEHHFGTEWISDAEYHWHECTDKGCNAISGKAPHEWTGWRIDEPMGMHNRFCNCGYNDYSHHYNLVYAAAGEAGHYQYCALGNCTFKTSTVPHNYDGDTCTICNYTKSGEIVPPTPDNPGTIVIIRPAEEEKPAQQPNPSTGANDLVGLAVAAAVAAALGSAALLRKHD